MGQQKKYPIAPFASHDVKSEELKPVASHDKPVAPKMDILKLYRTIAEEGGPIKPVLPARREAGEIKSNTGLSRLSSFLPFSDEEPLSQNNVIDAIFGTGSLDSLADPANVSPGGALPAGMPFSAYKKKNFLDKVYHGTNKNFDMFNWEKNDANDVLGWLVHAAEDPSYASGYAFGDMKHGGTKQGAKMIPLKPEAQNVLDLVDPTADDMAQILPFAENKDELIRLFKKERKSFRGEDASMGFKHESHNKAPASEYPIRKIAENVRLSRKTTENMPWDAIRYHDMSYKSWAFPESTPLKNIFDVPLNEAAQAKTSPIKMVRDDAVSTGMFPTVVTPPNSFDQYLKKPAKKYSNIGDKPGPLNIFDLEDAIKSGKYADKNEAMKAVHDSYDGNKIGSGDKYHLEQLVTNKFGKFDYNGLIKNEHVNWTPGLNTPYVAVDKDGIVHTGAGDKQMLIDQYPDMSVVPNKYYQVGNGDGGKPFKFTVEEHEYMNPKPKKKDSLFDEEYFKQNEDPLPIDTDLEEMPMKSKGKYVVMNTKGKPEYQYFNTKEEAQAAGNMPGKDWDETTEFLKYNKPKNKDLSGFKTHFANDFIKEFNTKAGALDAAGDKLKDGAINHDEFNAIIDAANEKFKVKTSGFKGAVSDEIDDFINTAPTEDTGKWVITDSKGESDTVANLAKQHKYTHDEIINLAKSAKWNINKTGKALPVKPKESFLKTSYKNNPDLSGQYLTKVGTKEFPHTKMGFNMATKHLETMITDGAITMAEGEKYLKELKKAMPKGVQ